MKWRNVLLFAILSIALVAPVFAGGRAEVELGPHGYPLEVEAWLEEVKLGPWAETEIDYDKLYQAALQEGSVIIYAGTSRMGRVAESFEAKYPGLTVEADMMGTSEVIEKFAREAQAGMRRADLVQASQAGRQQALLYDRNHLFAWVPPDLAHTLSEDQKSPYVHWRYGSRQWIYNDSLSNGEPFSNIWELTEPDWSGRVVVGDPRQDGGTLDYFILTTVYDKDMERAYAEFYGRPYSGTAPNAGYEWIKRFFDNRPNIVTSERDVPRIVGSRDHDRTMVGLIAGSRFRTVGDPAGGNLRFFPMLDMQPSIGSISIYPIGIAYRAPNPNAAKLFIRHLFGDDQGGGGFAPFWEPGNWPGRNDIETVPEISTAPDVAEALWPLSSLNFWVMDEGAVYDRQGDVLDFIIDIF
jgi:iron(III) transport system substrate-binding protein